MPLYHLTEDGPKICKAKVGNCPLGGAHFQSKIEAAKVYEQEMGGSQFTTVRRSPLAQRPSQFASLDTSQMQSDAHRHWKQLSQARKRKRTFRYLRRAGYALAASALIASCGNMVRKNVESGSTYSNNPNVPSLSHDVRAVEKGIHNEMPTLRGTAQNIASGARHDYRTSGTKRVVDNEKAKVNRYLNSTGPQKAGQSVGRDGRKVVTEGKKAIPPIKKFATGVRQGYNSQNK